MRSQKQNGMAASIGALAIASGAIGATTHISGNTNMLEVSEGPAGHIGVTLPGTTPSFPYLLFREYSGSAYDQRVFMRTKLSSVPAGSIVIGATLGIFFTDSTYGGYFSPHSDYVDLWSTADEFTEDLSFTTFNGSTNWTDGPQAGIDGSARTGPAGRFLDNLWFQGTEPAGTPSSKIINQIQEYKIFSSAELNAYLQSQLDAGKDAYLAMSTGNVNADYLRFVSTSDDGTHWPTVTGNPIFGNQPYLDITYLPPGSGIWNLDNNGSWSISGNWQHNAPNGAGSEALFGSAITAARTVTVDAPQIVGGMTFDNINSYTIDGPATITLQATTGAAAITVSSGSHAIAAPVALSSDLTVTVTPAASTLVISSLQPSNKLVTKEGAGVVELANVRAGGLTVNGGSVRIGAKGTANSPAGTSVLSALTVAVGAGLDLTNNSLIIDYTSIGTLVDDVRQALLDSRLLSSSADATRSLGYADNALLGKTNFGGQPVDATSLLVKFTYLGDANLDGQVDITDLASLATSWQTANVWTGGDFNYDGFVDITDLAALATNWQAGVGAPLSMSIEQALASLGLPGVSVPEPALLILGLPLILASRRRTIRPGRIH